jgi:hypothetical protein
MIGALEPCPCDGDLGNVFGRCSGLTMLGRCSGLTMLGRCSGLTMLGRCSGLTMLGRCSGLTVRSTHSSAVSSLFAATTQVVVFGLETVCSRRLFPGGTSSARPKGPQPAPDPISSRPSGSLGSIHGVVVSPPNGWSSAVKGREGPPVGINWPAWGTTLMCDVDHVISWRN